MSALLTGFVTRFVSIILAIPFIFFMYIGIRILGRRLGKIICDSAINELIMYSKLGRKPIRLSDEFNRRLKGEDGTLRLFKKLFLMNFIAVLLISKYLGPAAIPEQVGSALISFLIATVIGVFASTIISPLTTGLYVIDNSQIRMFNLKEGLIEKPGILIRRIFRALFGYGNLIVLIYVLLDSIELANGDIAGGLVIFTMLVALVYGAIALAAMVASAILAYRDSGVFNNLLEEFTSKAAEKSISIDEAITFFKELFGVTEHEEPERILQESG